MTSYSVLAKPINKTRCVLRASFLFVLSITWLISACSPSLQSLQFSGQTMGTSYNITIVVDGNFDQGKQQRLKQHIDQCLQRINQLMSTYIADSELSLFNQSAPNQWYQVSEETFAVLRYSQSLSKQSQGKFDITVSPLINLWGFDAEKMVEFPSDQAIQVAKQQVGWEALLLDEETQQIQKQKPLTINLSAVAKGYGVDQIALLLEEQGISDYLVEIGGEIRVKGHNSQQQLWRIGVESPSFLQSGVQEVIQLDDKAVATSGDYRNFFERDGIRYSHTIDPATGKPVIHNIASLTVVADNAMAADGLATAFMVMGEEQALAMATQYNIPIYILLYEKDTFRAVHSPEFAAHLNEN